MRKQQTFYGSYVLWLPSWYPEELDPLNGDFVQRHARALSAHMPVDVVYVVKDPEGKITRDVSISKKIDGGLSETIIHYYTPPFPIPAIHKLRSFNKLKRIYQQQIRELIKKKGTPLLTHVYIAYKAGLIGLWLKKNWNIPYVVTEQWTLYLPEAADNYQQLSAFRKAQFRKIFRHAKKVSVVSKYLGERLKELFNIPAYQVIPNVVDEKVFFPSDRQPSDTVTIVHISALNYQKDPENMLHALDIVRRTHPRFEFVVIGPGWERIKTISDNLQLPVRYTGSLTQAEIADYLRDADALMLYSRYETFGCVLIEAHACGLPTIVSDIPVIRENVIEGFNGVFARKEDPQALASQIIYFIENKEMFKKKEIAEKAVATYSYDSVGLAFLNWYQGSIN